MGVRRCCNATLHRRGGSKGAQTACLCLRLGEHIAQAVHWEHLGPLALPF